LQEYYRQVENYELIIKQFINDRTPRNIKIILKICITLIFHSKKPHYAIVNEAVEFGKKFKKESLINAVLREVFKEARLF
jgi:transcription termination factor NusB